MIVVTGANGFIGSALVWELNQAGRNDIVCVDTVPPLDRPEPLRNRSYSKFLLKDEIWAFLATDEAKKNVESILHMGACSATTEMNVAFLNENNVEYTRRLWNWCTENKKPYIYASSAAVYGDGIHGFDDTKAPDIYKPLNPYGESKAEFDRWAVKQTATPPLWVGLRFFNVYGPNEYHKDFMASVVFKAFNEITKTSRLKLFRSHKSEYKDGMQLRDFVYVKDITRWVLELLTKSGIKSGIYNMGFGQARTWLDLASATFKNMDKKPEIDWVDIPESIRDRYQYVTEAKMDKLLSIGLSAPQWPIEKGVADYVSNYLAKNTRGL
ncbi:MAG: ADP-glyceromanno-heptose 6-epimerase [Proteobacteria bacterium]|nr:MAG: ADP-glyceromanno-heptose 6-epimerase [Pseudomonadota bacterium]